MNRSVNIIQSEYPEMGEQFLIDVVPDMLSHIENIIGNQVMLSMSVDVLGMGETVEQVSHQSNKSVPLRVGHYLDWLDCLSSDMNSLVDRYFIVSDQNSQSIVRE